MVDKKAIMGINRKIKRFEEMSLEKAGMQYQGLSWGELGAQRVWRSGGKSPAKGKYIERGVAEHLSFDLSGMWGSLAVDLDYPIAKEFLNRFDVVTNYGTIEHVNNQYQVFKNMHDMCRVGGLMIHAFPKEGTWIPHGRYYYSEEFAREFAEACGYEINKIGLLNYRGVRTGPRMLVMASYLKSSMSEYISRKKLKSLPLIDSGDMRKTGNYTV